MIVTVAAPGAARMAGAWRLRSSAQQLALALRECSVAAVSKKTECRFTIHPDGSYEAVSAVTGARPEGTVAGGFLSGGVVSTSDPDDTFSFYPSGMAEAGTITLLGAFAGRDGVPATVTIRIYRSGLMRAEDTI